MIIFLYRLSSTYTKTKCLYNSDGGANTKQHKINQVKQNKVSVDLQLEINIPDKNWGESNWFFPHLLLFNNGVK